MFAPRRRTPLLCPLHCKQPMRIKMQIVKILKSGRSALAAAVILCAGAAQLPAQSATANQLTSEDHSNTAGGASTIPVNPNTEAILKELDAMRARIQELEAQLK